MTGDQAPRRRSAVAAGAAGGALLAAALALVLPWAGPAAVPASGGAQPSSSLGDDLDELSALQQPSPRKHKLQARPSALAQRSATSLWGSLSQRAKAALEDPAKLQAFRDTLGHRPAQNEVEQMVQIVGLLSDGLVKDDSSAAAPGGASLAEGRAEARRAGARRAGGAEGCSQDTGGTCHASLLGTGDCFAWRGATCVSGKCMCKAGQCARSGMCVTPVAEPAPPAEHVAIVGCGIAGALTALEVAHRGAEVTLIDREKDCGQGTSGRIAAEMEFYSFDKDAFHGPWSDVEAALTVLANNQVSASPNGALNAVRYASASSRLGGESVTVTLKSYKKGDFTFESGPESPVLVAQLPSLLQEGRPRFGFGGANAFGLGHGGPRMQDDDSDNRDTVPAGASLVKVGGLSMYTLSDMNKAEDTDAALQDFLATAPMPLELTFVSGADPRMNRVYQAEFFRQAGERLRDFHLVNFPELCEAVVTPWCCEPGTKARAWVEANFEKVGYRCPKDPFDEQVDDSPDNGMGVVHVFTSQTAVDAVSNKTGYSLAAWTKEQTETKMKNFLEGQPNLSGGAHNALSSGFVRTELVFKVIKEILESKFKVNYLFNTDVADFTPTAEGVTVSHRRATGTWNKDQGGMLKFVDMPASDLTVSQSSFSRVVVSTGAAIGEALAKLDPSLSGDGFLIPCYGYVVLGLEGKLQAEDKDVGVVFEVEKQYVRATRSGAVAMGGGMFFGDPDDEAVRSLPWMERGQAVRLDAESYMRQTSLGAALMDDPKHTLLGAVRPMSVYVYMPLLRTYANGRIVLNTGASTNGFVVSWKAGQLAADLAMTGETEDKRWRQAVTHI